MDKKFYVYGLFKKEENRGLDECFYIGKGSDDRLNHHLNDFGLKKPNWTNPHKCQKILKEKRNNNTLYARKIISHVNSEEKAFEIEKKLISEIGINCLTNMRHGGSGLSGKNHPMYGKNHSEDSKRIMRKKAKKRYQNPENHPCYGKTGEDHPRYGIEHDEEFKEKMSNMMEGENNPMYGVTGKDHPNYGKSLDKKTKEKISKTLKEKYKNDPNQHPFKGLTGKDHPCYGTEISKKNKKALSESNKGSGNGNSKLDEESVREIKWLIEKTNLTQKEISNRYNVCRKTVSFISRGKRWSHVTEIVKPD